MDIEQIRKDFEAHNEAWIHLYTGNDRREDGEYLSTDLEVAWKDWQAAHAHYAKPAAPVVLPPHPDTARLQHAVWRLEDLLKDDDPQAWKEARKFLERLKKEQWQEAQPQADAQTAALLEREAFEAWWRENVSQGLAEIDYDYRYLSIWQARAAIAKATGAESSVAQPLKGNKT